jgi:hypothetical protein
MTADGLFSSSSTAQSRRRWETDNRQVEMMPQVGTPYVQPDSRSSTPAVTHPTERSIAQQEPTIAPGETHPNRRRWETDNRQVEMMPQVGTPYVQPDTPAVTHPTEQVALQSAHSAGLLDLCSMQTCVAR